MDAITLIVTAPAAGSSAGAISALQGDVKAVIERAADDPETKPPA
jgi:hypothetical protein